MSAVQRFRGKRTCPNSAVSATARLRISRPSAPRYRHTCRIAGHRLDSNRERFINGLQIRLDEFVGRIRNTARTRS